MKESRKKAYENLSLSVSALIPVAEDMAGEEEAVYNVLSAPAKESQRGGQLLLRAETAMEAAERLRQAARCLEILSKD